MRAVGFRVIIILTSGLWAVALARSRKENAARRRHGRGEAVAVCDYCTYSTVQNVQSFHVGVTVPHTLVVLLPLAAVTDGF